MSSRTVVVRWARRIACHAGGLLLVLAVVGVVRAQHDPNASGTSADHTAPAPPSGFPAETGSPAFKRDHGKAVMGPAYGTFPVKNERRLYKPTGAQIKRLGAGLIVYSRYTPVSVDNKLIVRHGEDSSSARIYDRATNTLVRHLPNIGEDAKAGKGAEIRWHYGMDFPSRFYYVRGLEFRMMDARTGEDTLIRKFKVAGASYIANDVEGDSSNDSRYWVFMAMATPNQGSYYPREIFTYDRVNDVILGRLTAADYPQSGDRGRMEIPNMVEASPGGEKAIIHWNGGPLAYDMDLNKANTRKVAVASTHSGWIGKYEFVSQNDQDDYIESVNILTGKVTKLLYHGDVGWNNGFHFSKDYAGRGKIVVSTYASTNRAWGDNQIFGLDMQGQVTRIAHSHNKYPGNDGYRNEGAVASSFDGLGLYWTSNWGSGDRQRDAYEIRLPADW